jgi:L-arabinose isomerase
MIELYDLWPELKPKMAEFGEELARTIAPFAEVVFPGVCNTRAQVDQAVATFEAEGVDLIVAVLFTYAPSHISLPALIHTPLPILVWNTQRLYAVTKEVTGENTTENHGMHGVQDLCNVLLRAGREFHLVTGHYQDQDTLAEIKAWCDAAHAVRYLRQMRIGLMGYPMEGMGDFGIDQTALLAQVGVEVQQIAMKTVAEQAQAAPQDQVAQQMAHDRQEFAVADDVTDDQHEASSRIEWALRRILHEQGLHGFAAHFIAVSQEGWLDTLPFLAAAKLLGEGYGFGGEGDVTSAAAVAMMAELAGAANFTETFTMDFAGNAMLMMHMGEGNWKMARRDEPVHMLPSTLGLFDLRVDPLLLAFSLEPGVATLVNLTTAADGRLKFIVSEGQVVDFPYVPALARPHYKFKPNGDLEDFLTRLSLEGASHHHALVYGHWSGTVSKIAALLGVDCACL